MNAPLVNVLELHGLLALVIKPSIAAQVIAAWSVDQRGAAEEWAHLEHRAAYDPELRAEPMPLHVALAAGRAELAEWPHAVGSPVVVANESTGRLYLSRTCGAPYLLDDGTAVVDLEAPLGACALRRVVIDRRPRE